MKNRFQTLRIFLMIILITILGFINVAVTQYVNDKNNETVIEEPLELEDWMLEPFVICNGQ